MATSPASETRTDTPGISTSLERNIDALMRRREDELRQESLPDRIARGIAAFTGSSWSLLVHAIIFGVWILINTGLLPLMRPWDPTLVVLAMEASVEAIFLTTCVLMNQNRIARMEDDRAELTLQISLLAEHEMTDLARMVAAIAERLDVQTLASQEKAELTQELSPEHVLDEIVRRRPGGQQGT